MQSLARWSMPVLLLAAVAAHAQVFDKKNVEKFMTEMDQAQIKQDAAGMEKFLSPAVTITMSITQAGKKQTTEMSRSEYIASARQNFAAAKDYRYQRSNTKIEIAGGGKKAVVTAKNTESMKMQGLPVTGVSQVTLTVELIDGQPMVTSVVADGTVK
ncbi:MAG: nuclear transport factor 2 family protein [Betaproteobacteria bacterium]|nr:nuclear transport factor 2 family protein [Betaproteobacteria bacterium]